MIHHGDCVEVMATLPAASVDAVVTDPPYGLGFMGKAWDTAKAMHLPPSAQALDTPLARFRTGKGPAAVKFDPHVMQEWHHRWALEAFRVAKPGAYLLAFGGTRTVHRLAVAIEDAGWVIRDMLCWTYLSGFPKSHNVSRALAEAVPEDARCACGPRSTQTALGSQGDYRSARDSDDGRLHPVADTARSSSPSPADALGHSRDGRSKDGPVEGRGRTPVPESIALPASDYSPLAVSPLEEDSRSSDSVPSDKPSSTSADSLTELRRTDGHTQRTPGSGDGSAWSPSRGDTFPYSKCSKCGGWQTADGWGTALKPAFEPIILARKPLAGSVADNVQQYGTGALNIDGTRIPGEPWQAHDASGLASVKFFTDGEASVIHKEPAEGGRWPANMLTTGAALGDYDRFFKVPKADRADREPVLRGQLPEVRTGAMQATADGSMLTGSGNERTTRRANVHPTVKPTELMRHLVRLVTPVGGTVLDPFLGSGTTAIAAEQEGFAWIGIEKEAEYVAIANARLNGVQRGLGLDVPAPTRKHGGESLESLRAKGGKHAVNDPASRSRQSALLGRLKDEPEEAA